MNRTALFTMILAAALGWSAAAQAHSDALAAVDGSGKLVSGTADLDHGEYTVGQRVYEGEVEEVSGTGLYTGSEPGFNAVSQAHLPAGAYALTSGVDVRFDVPVVAINGSEANLFYWDGQGDVDFVAVTGGTTMRISKSPSIAFSSFLDGSETEVTGFVIDTVGTGGLLHKHLDFTLDDGDGNVATFADSGFYLFGLTLGMAGATDSDPLYFVLGAGAENEAAHEAAVDWVNANVVPEPVSIIILLSGATLVMRRRVV